MRDDKRDNENETAEGERGSIERALRQIARNLPIKVEIRQGHSLPSKFSIRATHNSGESLAVGMSGGDSMEDLIRKIRESIFEEGWDVIGYNSTDAYNDRILNLKKNLQLLPNNKLILCIGNSKKLWTKAKKLLDRGKQDPFDAILTPQAIDKCYQICHNSGVSCTAYETISFEPFLVSFQDLAVATGIGAYSDEIKLVIHPIYGPWFALRFALLIDCEWDQQSNLISHRSIDTFSLEGVDFSEAKELLSTSADGTLAGGGGFDPFSHIAARRSITIGSDEIYSEEQILYHYHISSPS
jgi:hypothetical protein